MKYTIISILAVSILLPACNHKHAANSEHANHDQVLEQVSIELDGGEPWKVNLEMVPHIMAQEEALNEYITSSKIGRYQQLAEDLKKHNSKLISSCTMDGKSHEELHKWLHPHIELIEALKNAKTEDDAKTVIHNLEESFRTYNTYFQ